MFSWHFCVSEEKKTTIPIQTVSKGKRFEWKLCLLCSVLFLSTSPQGESEVLLWLLVQFHEYFFLPFSCLICTADTHTACAYTRNTVTHSISQPCHRTSTPRLFSNTAGFTICPYSPLDNWLLIKRSQRKLAVSITTKAGWLPTFSCIPS